MDNANNIDETLDILAGILIRCIIMCVIVLLFWFAAILLAGDLVYRFHGIFLHLSRESFNAIQYAGAMTFKGLVSVLFVFPYIAIKLVQKKRGNQGR